MPDESTPASGPPRHTSRLKWIVASAWALIVGTLMAAGAALLDLPPPDFMLIGVLGGIGAAASVFMFAAK